MFIFIIIIALIISCQCVYADETVYVEDIKGVEYNEYLGEKHVDGTTYYKVTVDDADDIDCKREPVFTVNGYTRDPYNTLHQQAHLYNNGIMPLHEKGIMGKGIKIAVIDAGIEITSEIADSIDFKYGYNFVQNKPIEIGDPCRIDHGTNVISVISAKKNNSHTIGVATGAKVIPLMIGDDECVDLDALISALRYLKNNLEKGELKDLRVVNMSFSQIADGDVQDVDYYLKEFAYDSEIADLIKEISDYGVTFVGAAGNSGNEYYGDDYLGDNAAFPADLPYVTSVAYTDRKNRLSRYSNLRQETDLIAVGKMACVSGENGISMENGTSLSAPVVSGTIALILSQNPRLSGESVVNALKKSGTTLRPDKKNKRDPSVYKGKTVMNAAFAYNRLFKKKLKIDLKYGDFELENIKTSLPLTVKRLFNDPDTFGMNMYGFSLDDVPECKLTKKKSGNKYKYTLYISGDNFVRRNLHCTIKYYEKPKIGFSSGKGYLKISYTKPEDDCLVIKIRKNNKLIKKFKVDTHTTKHSERVKLPKGKYKVNVTNRYYSAYGTCYKGSLNVSSSIDVR